MMCVRCGTVVDDRGVVTDDYAYCEECEDAYQASLRAEYPHGQCQECGAAYHETVCKLDRVHTYAMHVEGACSQWGDVPDLPPETEEQMAANGYCPMGCRPQPEAFVPASSWTYRSDAQPDDDDFLPF